MTYLCLSTSSDLWCHQEGSCDRLWSLDFFDLKNSSRENGLKDEKKISHNGFNKSRFIIKPSPPFSIVALWFPTFCSKSLISNLIVLSIHSLKNLFFLGANFDWIFRRYWFSVTIISSVLMHSTMLRAYWKLEINGTVRPAQLECLILETRIETNSNRSFRLRIALKIPWTDSPYLSHSNVTNFILDHVHPWFWTGGGGRANTPPRCPNAFWSLSDWVARLFITVLSLFCFTSWQNDRSESNWKIENLTQMTSPWVLNEDINLLTFLLIIDTFLRSKQYLKSVLKQTYWDYYDIIWSRMHGSISQLLTMKPKKRSFTRRRFRNCAPCSWRGKVQESPEIK